MIIKSILIICLFIFLNACTTGQTINSKITIVDEQIIDCAKDYQVRGNETLYYLAKVCGFSIRELAKINSIYPPYKLHLKQKIRFDYTDKILADHLNQKYPTSQNIVSKPVVPYDRVIFRSHKKVKKDTKWTTPVMANIKDNFNANKQRLGVSYKTKPGQSVYTIANGVVVYSDNKMLSHGQMIIIKHANNFYSSYTQNAKTLVKVGNQVKIGETIAITGNNPLYLEMRHRSKVINPNQYIRP